MRLMSTEEAVRAFHKDRLSNDPQQLRDWFADEALVRINGTAIVKTEGDKADPEATLDLEALTPDELLNEWFIHASEVRETMAEGERAASRVWLDISHRPSGHRTTLELAEFIRFDGERITEMIAFLDSKIADEIKKD